MEAEATHWEQHVKCDAVRVHLPNDAAMLRRKVPKGRIIKARFAHRDKNVAKHREDPQVPWKATARLCVGGHMDPDLKTGELNTEAPTAERWLCSLPSSLLHRCTGSWPLAMWSQLF